MAVERELSLYGQQHLEEMMQPYYEMHAIRDTLEGMLKEFHEKHKTRYEDLDNCCDTLQVALDDIDNALLTIHALRADFIEQLMESSENVERYCGD